MKNSNLKKALYVLLYDQYDVPDLEVDANDNTYIEYIIDALIEKNQNTCPFKCYDCIGHCKDNFIECVDGLNVGCTKEIKEIWKEFIDIGDNKD